MILAGLVIPAHTVEPIKKREVDPRNIEAYEHVAGYQAIVGGNIEVVRLERPAASMYLNEEGKLNGLRPNPRATALMWVHSVALRGADIIVGDAYLVGPCNHLGYDLPVPDELVNLILNVERFHVEEQSPSNEEWHSDGHVFTNWYAAYRWAAIRSTRDDVNEVRVVGAK
jgi:hypothetical protein